MSRHRAPEPPPRIDWRWHTVAALAGLGILAPPVTLWAQAVAPDASGLARTQVSTVTRAQETAGPLETLSIGVVAPAVESLYPTPSAAPERPVAVSRGTRTGQTAPEAAQEPLVAITDPSEPTVTPPPQPVTTDRAATEAPSPDPAAVTTDSATPTGEPVEIPTETVVTDADVTEVVGP